MMIYCVICAFLSVVAGTSEDTAVCAISATTNIARTGFGDPLEYNAGPLATFGQTALTHVDSEGNSFAGMLATQQ